MKKASHILYTIGKWFQLALVILGALYAIGMIIGSIVSFVNENYVAGALLLVFCPAILVFEIAVWIVVLIAIKKQKANSKDKVPHIMCIVAGVIGQNYCYVVGAIFALILISKGQEVEPIQSISKEQVKNAVKKDKKEEDVKDVESKPVEEKPEEKPAEAEEVEEAESAEEAKPAE